MGQYDLLLDGASSVYGSDAIGGVANVILRNDFDGFEIDVFPDDSARMRTASRPSATADLGQEL